MGDPLGIKRLTLVSWPIIRPEIHSSIFFDPKLKKSWSQMCSDLGELIDDLALNGGLIQFYSGSMLACS